MIVRVTETYDNAAPGAEPNSWLFENVSDLSLTLAIVLDNEARDWREYNKLFVTAAVDELCAMLEAAAKTVVEQRLTSIQVGEHFYQISEV
ncbi:hypothetical protein LZ318_11850 [Saccharopolyspora indica]|uniref:hypothetical protein n=1 Tax=Saccharopolyspora indica TaxID=1229659 RepID=UPI0022EAD142|nr:hypothetical protein [Saccharopolyspora indica]MDA3643795.1 hypothetical protein [Saccharopolyspora indica]